MHYYTCTAKTHIRQVTDAVGMRDIGSPQVPIWIDCGGNHHNLQGRVWSLIIAKFKRVVSLANLVRKRLTRKRRNPSRHHEPNAVQCPLYATMTGLALVM